MDEAHHYGGSNLHPVAQVLFENQGRASKNKAVDLEDMKFHQCVRLTRFENDRTISFIPPDGAFDLMCAPLPPQRTFIFRSVRPPIVVIVAERQPRVCLSRPVACTLA